MKKLLLLLFFVSVASYSNAQNLSFEETLAYLNKAAKNETAPIRTGGLTSGKNTDLPDIITEDDMITWSKESVGAMGPNDRLQSIGINKNGDYIITRSFSESFNLFKLNQRFFLYENRILYSTKKRGIDYFEFINEKEAARFFRALQHINSFCKEDKDPFDK